MGKLAAPVNELNRKPSDPNVMNRKPSDPSGINRKIKGAFGERVACEWYLSRGYELLAQNWRCREGEIDLIFKDQSYQCIVFCEVRTRTILNRQTSAGDKHQTFMGKTDQKLINKIEDGITWALESVNARKQRQMYQMAKRYLDTTQSFLNFRGECRFDVAAVVLANGTDHCLKIEVIEQVF